MIPSSMSVLCRPELSFCVGGTIPLLFIPVLYLFIVKTAIGLGLMFYADCAEKLFDLVDGFAESTKRKAAVWPLQIILLVLCPEIIQDIAKDVVEETKMNKVRE